MPRTLRIGLAEFAPGGGKDAYDAFKAEGAPLEDLKLIRDFEPNDASSG